MLQANGIDHLNLFVKDLEKTVEFYREVFGFREKEEGESQVGPYKIIGEKDRLYLCLYEYPKAFESEPGGPFNHLGIHVENFSQTLEVLRQKGIQWEYDGIIQNGASKSVYITDPNGIEIELSEKFGGDLR